MANVKIGDAALAFELPAVDDKTYSLAEISAGKDPTVVLWMCNHCPYVFAWFDRLNTTARDYAGKGVAFVASTPTTRPSMRPMIWQG